MHIFPLTNFHALYDLQLHNNSYASSISAYEVWYDNIFDKLVIFILMHGGNLSITDL